MNDYRELSKHNRPIATTSVPIFLLVVQGVTLGILFWICLLP